MVVCLNPSWFLARALRDEAMGLAIVLNSKLAILIDAMSFVRPLFEAGETTSAFGTTKVSRGWPRFNFRLIQSFCKA